MGFRSVFLLLLALAAIGGGLWLTQDDPGTGQVSLMRSALDGRSMLSAETIELSFDSSRIPIELARSDAGTYRLVEPVRDLASQAMLDNLARVYDSAQLKVWYEPEDVTPHSLKETGLDTPSGGYFRAAWADGHVVQLAFGGAGTFGDDLFVKKGDTVFTGSAALRSAMTVNLDDYRERFVFRNQLASAARIRLTRHRANEGKDDVFTFIRTGGQFGLAEHPELELNQAIVRQELLEPLLGIRATAFVTGHLQVGPKLADFTLEVEGGGGRESATLYLDVAGRPIGWLEPRKIAFQFAVNRLQAVFAAPLNALRSQLLFSPEILEEVEQISIVKPTSALALSRSPSGMALSVPVDSPSNPTSVSELVAQLRDLHIVRFVEDRASDLTAYGLDENFLQLKLVGGPPRRETAEIHIGDPAPDGSGRFARRADSQSVVTIASTSLTALDRGWEDYASLEVMSIPAPATIVGMRIAREGQPEVRLERNDKGAWIRDGSRVDDAADVFDLARKLVGKRVVPGSGVDSAARSTAALLSFVTQQGRVVRELEVLLGASPLLVRAIQAGNRRKLWHELSHRDAQDLRQLIEF